MYLPIPTQTDCPNAWLEAVKQVNQQPGHAAYNAIIDIANPVINTTRSNRIVAAVDEFLRVQEKSVLCVANTIFPEALYRQHGAEKLFTIFENNILPKVRRNDRWSGYYFERMISHPTESGETINPLWNIIERIRNDKVRALNKFELTIFDPERDVDDSPYGGQCLSFLSFKLIPGEQRTLTLTALYRNHYYIDKLLGNLIGLGRLMGFVAKESGVNVGSLTVISTHAVIDTPKGATRSNITDLINRCNQTQAETA